MAISSTEISESPFENMRSELKSVLSEFRQELNAKEQQLMNLITKLELEHITRMQQYNTDLEKLSSFKQTTETLGDSTLGDLQSKCLTNIDLKMSELHAKLSLPVILTPEWYRESISNFISRIKITFSYSTPKSDPQSSVTPQYPNSYISRATFYEFDKGVKRKNSVEDMPNIYPKTDHFTPLFTSQNSKIKKRR